MVINLCNTLKPRHFKLPIIINKQSRHACRWVNIPRVLLKITCNTITVDNRISNYTQYVWMLVHPVLNPLTLCSVQTRAMYIVLIVDRNVFHVCWLKSTLLLIGWYSMRCLFEIVSLINIWTCILNGKIFWNWIF